ncbi:putative acetyltransferase [Lysinibacillus piscis]|uniref:Acetyltransferase n=2 Tax=Lysinibacillus piscis TaxID=2518931 RepID=A0ABQ5NGP9_9BACI|nr:putative acetyltransferase [Lysinibacillus sp. KH24]
MALFSPIITDFWQTFFQGEILYQNEYFTCFINPALKEDEQIMMLTMGTGQILVTMTPALAGQIQLAPQQNVTEQWFRQTLQERGIVLHGADYLYYFSEDDKRILLQENEQESVRQLTKEDKALFTEFESTASEQDLDDAYVELDHWLVFGSLAQNRLVCAASMYPWRGSLMADTGILTLASFRGQGHARKVVRAISRCALRKGYEPQYRCQVDNEPSIALAKVSGFTLFGKWEVLSPDSVIS